MKGGGEMKLPRKLKDGQEYHIEAAGCNVTFILHGWEGREEEIKDKFARSPPGSFLSHRPCASMISCSLSLVMLPSPFQFVVSPHQPVPC